jgi:hypothetical protein
MPIPKAQLDRIIDSVEQYLNENKEKMRDKFYADSPPARIHGSPEKLDQEAPSLWGAKPKVPVPIETI